MVNVTDIHIVIPGIVGIILGFLEAFFVYEDENNQLGSEFMKDLWHGLIFAILGTIIASNTPYIASLIPTEYSKWFYIDGMGRSLVMSILVTLFMLLKMVASHKMRGNISGFKEKFIHKLIIATLVGFSPYYVFELYNMSFFVNLAKSIPWLPM